MLKKFQLLNPKSLRVIGSCNKLTTDDTHVPGCGYVFVTPLQGKGKEKEASFQY